MAILINLDLMLAKRKVKSRELAAYVGITEQNLSLLKSGKVKGMRFSTLEKICERLACQPGDILTWVQDEGDTGGDAGELL
ncbi:helix-turn-helix domain-containing protein [Duganella violaceipulchra]|uniref:Transcriptional regulator n=1 Tax=Duganella violaceipulchra TaxID=2849652 RepID=A0AA41H4T2_9BURK|nr:helix-turn-helix transcriptional regulator [Duganella violaceicalia]MBV6321588.1 helix-turn-helix transcriptional regulator [Duganella violaceicalia]MCP2008152.1 putative transcriptional regulator [Duganella violaceicalia]